MDFEYDSNDPVSWSNPAWASGVVFSLVTESAYWDRVWKDHAGGDSISSSSVCGE